MRIVLSPLAVRRLREIQGYIAYDNLKASAQVVQRIRQTMEMLADHPKMGRDWDTTTRAVVVPGLPYRVHYRIDEAAGVIEVISVVHTSQLPPEV